MLGSRDWMGGRGAGLCGIGATVKTMQMDKGTGEMTKGTLVGNLNTGNQICREGKCSGQEGGSGLRFWVGWDPRKVLFSAVER